MHFRVSARKPIKLRSCGHRRQARALQEIAVKIAEKVSKAGCDSSKCVLLVSDFYTSSETTSRVGLKFSDEFATLLAKTLTDGIVVNRAYFRQYMDRNRIPLKLVEDDESERWLGRELGITTVLLAELDFTRAGQNAKFNLLSSGLNKKMQSGKASVEMNLPALTCLPEDLLAVEPYPTLEKIQKSQAGDAVFQLKTQGLNPPHCSYMPNPSYPDGARDAKFSGTLMIDAIVTVLEKRGQFASHEGCRITLTEVRHQH